MDQMESLNKKLSSSQVIILGFAGAILLGSLLLMLPFATNDGRGAIFADAIFTATSAVCVTGLVVKDTATYWSGFGQLVILTLIQIGGMGVVTIAIAIAMHSGGKISLKQRSMMQESISAHNVGGIIRLTSFIIKMTVIFELLGAILIAPALWADFGFLKGSYYAVFHSISAFCNAGFDLMGIKSPFSSMTSYVANPLINITLMNLIIIGGISFMTWDDIRTNKLNFRKYTMQTKVILSTTAALILLPAVYFFFFEFRDVSPVQRFLSALFQAVSPRTAGFNTVNLSEMSEVGNGITVILMLIGGSPGSTAGGIKTTTIAILISTAISVFRKREHTHFFGRRVDDEAIRNAVTILILYLVIFISAGFVISAIEGVSLFTCLYEAASAIGTVGLSLGLTPKLGLISKFILVILMYIGRVGGLTLIFSALSGRQGNTARLPQEKLTVG